MRRKLYHGLGDVDPEDPVACVYELPRPLTATATEVDHEALMYPVTVQDLQNAGRSSKANSAWPTSCMYAMSSPYHRFVSGLPRLSQPPVSRTGRSVEEGDGFPVDGPVETAEHDGAGIERAHGALADSWLAFLDSRVGGEASIMMRACVTSIVTWLVKISSASSGKPAAFLRPSERRA